MTTPGPLADYGGALLEALDNAGIALAVTLDRGAAGLERLHHNAALERLLGRTAAELAATPVLVPVAPAERSKLLAIRAAINAGDDAPPMIETEIERPDGTRVPVELGVTVRREPAGVVSLVFLRDISERRALQARMLEADRLATVAALCAGVAHEINNPLTYVMLHAAGLRRNLARWIPEPQAQAHVATVLDTMLEGSERVRGAVRELMMFADPRPQRREAVAMRDVVEGVVRMSAPMVETRARLAVALVDVPPVDGDPARLGQVVLDVILDAALGFDHTDLEHHRVEVHLAADGDWVVLTVSDNGHSEATPGAGGALFPSRGPTGTGMG
ncbi:MAG: PAS domain S-box protein, partial [Myxococcales bacterium]|nr:PAS domain S-box protein [Myxococcales bacterium]